MKFYWEIRRIFVIIIIALLFYIVEIMIEYVIEIAMEKNYVYILIKMIAQIVKFVIVLLQFLFICIILLINFNHKYSPTVDS